VSRLDAELQSQLLPAGRPRFGAPPKESQDHWQSYEARLPRAFGTNANTPIALLVIDADGDVLYRSPQWATDLSVANLWTSRPSMPFPPSDSSIAPPQPNPPPARSDFSRRKPGLQRPDEPPSPPRFVTQRTSTGLWRIGAVTTPATQVAIAISLNAIDQEMSVIRGIFLISIPGVLLLVAAGAWAIAGSSLQSIRQLTTVIGNVTASGLEQRVPIGTTDVEFVELVQVFNQMLERLERSFKQSSRFSADAAHELKTPLAILQGELERTLQQAEPGSEVQQGLSNLLDEVRRLSGIVRKLLLLSLADAGRMNLYRVEVDLSCLLREMLEDIELLAPHLKVETELANGLTVRGDRDLLIQVLQNLISNAIKYNLPNGWIRMTAHRHGARVAIAISNSSKDILERDRQRIFDRFHRGDPARTRKVEGIGLGLSLAREIVRAHNGNLRLDPAVPGQTTFTLTLPVS
jgi:heavy metal sensor kinase